MRAHTSDKTVGHEDDQSPPSSSKVNEWKYCIFSNLICARIWSAFSFWQFLKRKKVSLRFKSVPFLHAPLAHRTTDWI